VNPEAASALLGTWGYPLYLLLFLLTAFGSPLTEDVLLLVGGYLIGAHVFSWAPTATIAYVGILGADLCLFWFGRKLRTHTLSRGFVRHVIRPGRLRLAARWFKRFGDGVIFLSRFVPGTRLLVFVSAGLRGVRLTRFVLLDGLAAAAWAPLLLWAGHWAGERMGSLGRTLDVIGDRVFWILLAIAVAYALRRWWLQRGYSAADAEP
jgi:membrane protein DedA with SNARE-associated domain